MNTDEVIERHPKHGYYLPSVIGNTAVCQCGVRKPLSKLSRGYAGWTEIDKPCYFCVDCIPF